MALTDLTQNYPIIIILLLLAVLFLGWKWWNDKHLTDVGYKITEKVKDLLSQFNCIIQGDQVKCKRPFANLGKRFSLQDAVDHVVQTMTRDLSVIDPGQQQQQQQQQPYPDVPYPGMQMPPPMMTTGPAMPAQASTQQAPGTSQSLVGAGGFGGLTGASGFGQSSSSGVPISGSGGQPPPLPKELQPIQTSVRGGSSGGAQSMPTQPQHIGYDPDAF